MVFSVALLEMRHGTSIKAGYREAMSDDPAAEEKPAQEPAAEATPAPVEPVETGYTPGGVPTFESVREKIETRYGTAIGASELAAETPEGRTVEEQYDARQRAAAERLAEIRKSMHPEEGETQ
jgi:phage shock protein A